MADMDMLAYLQNLLQGPQGPQGPNGGSTIDPSTLLLKAAAAQPQPGAPAPVAPTPGVNQVVPGAPPAPSLPPPQPAMPQGTSLVPNGPFAQNPMTAPPPQPSRLSPPVVAGAPPAPPPAGPGGTAPAPAAPQQPGMINGLRSMLGINPGGPNRDIANFLGDAATGAAAGSSRLPGQAFAQGMSGAVTAGQARVDKAATDAQAADDRTFKRKIDQATEDRAQSSEQRAVTKAKQDTDAAQIKNLQALHDLQGTLGDDLTTKQRMDIQEEVGKRLQSYNRTGDKTIDEINAFTGAQLPAIEHYVRKGLDPSTAPDPSEETQTPAGPKTAPKTAPNPANPPANTNVPVAKNDDPYLAAKNKGLGIAPSANAATPAPASGGKIPTVQSPADARKLPHGAQFYDPNGVLRTNP